MTLSEGSAPLAIINETGESADLNRIVEAHKDTPIIGAEGILNPTNSTVKLTDDRVLKVLHTAGLNQQIKIRITDVVNGIEPRVLGWDKI